MEIDAPDLLETIVAATRRAVEVREARTPMAALERAAEAVAPQGQAFLEAVSRPGRLNVIAECKRRSPSRGVLRADYDAAAVATSYARAGAAAISVLTEPTFFDGSLDDLRAVRQVVSIPVLRKDFIIADYQIVEARAAGADAILLIVAALEEKELSHLLRTAVQLDLTALVEVHDERELEKALDAGAGLVGVNNRNLRTLEVSLDASERLIARMPSSVTAIAESGLKTRGDLERLSAAGFRGFLIGERLMTAVDPGEALRQLLVLIQLACRSHATLKGCATTDRVPDPP